MAVLSAAIVMEQTGKDKRETALIVRIDSEDLKKNWLRKITGIKSNQSLWKTSIP